jgi:hypothetical protein
MKSINLKVYFKKRKQRLSISGISPHADWIVILSFSFILFLVGSLYTLHLYIKVNNGSLFETIETNISGEIDVKKQQIEDRIKSLEQISSSNSNPNSY